MGKNIQSLNFFCNWTGDCLRLLYAINCQKRSWFTSTKSQQKITRFGLHHDLLGICIEAKSQKHIAEEKLKATKYLIPTAKDQRLKPSLCYPLPSLEFTLLQKPNLTSLHCKKQGRLYAIWEINKNCSNSHITQ